MNNPQHHQSTMTMTKEDIIRDTIAHYCDTDENRFSVLNPDAKTNTCVYHHPDGHMCAFGRYIPDSLYHPDMEGAIADTLLGADRWAGLAEHIPFSTDGFFWRDLQAAHDSAAGYEGTLAERQADARALWECMLEEHCGEVSA